MAENLPPGSAANAGGDASARGMPYYEKLRKDLRETLAKKRQLDQTLATTEEAILKAETAYLEETTAGNIIKGFDNYIKGATVAGTGGGGGGGTSTRRRAAFTEADRVFSMSSVSSSRESPAPSSQTTPSHAATPTSLHGTNTPVGPAAPSNKGGANKKKKAQDKDKDKSKDKDEDEGETKPAKRSKITYSRD